jgi:hypothetical protein
MTNPSDQLADKIIHEQELIIGPIAWEQAGKVSGLRIDILKHEVSIEGDVKEVLTKLVAQYEKLFGAASREVCRDAVRPLLSQVPEGEIPAVLK